MRYAACLTFAVGSVAMIACLEPATPDSDGLSVEVDRPEHLRGEFTHEGVTVRFDAVETPTLTQVIVSSAEGLEVLRYEKTQDLITSSAYGGRATIVTDLAVVQKSLDMGALPEDQRGELSLDGAFVETGDQRAFTELEHSAEYAALPWLSRELGVNGFTGRSFPATLGVHMIAQQAARDLDIEVPPLAAAVAPTDVAGYCLDLQSDPGNNDGLGMCGPGTSCWSWVCGDCCCHDGCLSHDNTCRECKWYKPWNCLLCATFTSFAAGGCGTSCQSGIYAEPQCAEIGYGCGQDSDCCGHYPDANEAAAGAANIQCINGACKVPGTCSNSCGGYGGGCWCDAACVQFGDCCADVYQCGYGDGGGGGSCWGACGGYGNGCWCDYACSSYGDCCPDAGQACGYW